MKKILLFALSAILFFILASCKPEDSALSYEVSFNSAGGSTIESQSVEEDSLVTKPANPTKDLFEFRYWYTDDMNKPFDFSNPITSDISLNAQWGGLDVTITSVETFDFVNLTTEYEVEDNTLDLFYTANGSVPYVKVTDFFDILIGFIDPDVEFIMTEDENSLEIFYQYYDEDEDETYDLMCNFDLETNLITTNDPGFYYAYIYSTETNYGRNIEYLYDYELNEATDGSEVIYNLNLYELDLDFYDGSVVAPYYLVNQLFAGSSYYNVYFNGDELYGIYGQLSPSDTSDYSKIRLSSKNDTTVPEDLLLHSFNMLAFNLDYFYGLKDYKDIDSFYDTLEPYKSKLLSSNYRTVSQAIADFLYKTIDEPHTSYGFSGYYGSYSYNPSISSLSDYGENFNDWYMNGLVAVDSYIADKWDVPSSFSGWAADSPNRPAYWFIDDNSAVITFDSFDTADIDESTTWSDDAYESVFDSPNILPEVDNANRYLVYNQSSNTVNTTETLMWGLSSSFVSTYIDALESDGWTLVKEKTSKSDYHKDGYYTKTIADTPYMVNVAYDSTYSTAYIGLTDFIPTDYDSNWKITKNIENLIESDSAVYLEVMIKEIKAENSGVQNIGLDLTFNTGGNLGALYRIIGLMSDEPFGVSSFSRDTYSYSTTYVQTSYDSYDRYNWFLLSSYVTFSAANELTTIFKQNNIGVIIGQTSGGGTSSITPILLPDGTFFTMSSNNINCFRDSDGNYTFNETGIEPDFIIDQDELYDNDVLSNILNS
jgi:hypothetical protein